MAKAYKALSTVTVGSGGTSSIEFTNIPQTYTDLLMVLSGRTNAATVTGSTTLRINGDSSAIYSRLYLNSDGSTATSVTGSSLTGITSFNNNGNSSTSNTFGSAELYFPNYSLTSINKSFAIDSVVENNDLAATARIFACLYASNDAITSISVAPASSGSYLQYSTATLYGISNA